MRKTLLIIGGCVLLVILLVARLFFKQGDEMVDERDWFVKGLRYEFSARVDSLRRFNENSTKLWCQLTAGDPQVHREDSLKLLFKEHDMLYLIFHRAQDSIIFVMPNGKLVEKGDSLSVSSKSNSIEFFRTGELFVKDELTTNLTGYSRPFFMKNKD